MPAGEAFTARQQDDIRRMITLAEKQSDLHYSVYVGRLEGDTRLAAAKLHAALADPQDSVMIAVDPGQRRLEIVTGEKAKLRLDDRGCALAAVSMTTTFNAGDLAGGIVQGLQTLSEHLR